MKKRKSVIEELLEILFELTGMFWQVGAVITVLIAFLSIQSLFWIESLKDAQNHSIILAPLINSFSWLLYVLPISLAILTFIFAKKTYQIYLEQKI